MKKPVEVPDLKIKIISPFEIIFDGSGRALSAINEVGPFDVLPEHENFMTLLTKGEIRVLTDVDERKYPIQHGILKVHQNNILIFANI